MKIAIGALLVVAVALFAAYRNDDAIVAKLQAEADKAIAAEGGKGIRADFTGRNGWTTRHPTLHGGDDLDDGVRSRVARAVAAVPGVGGVHWANRKARAAAQEAANEPGPFHCQRDVESLLDVRVIRFAQSSAAIEEGSELLLDEVAEALKPCRGSIIAVSGHSDAVGNAAVNLRLSRERADAVRDALVARGLPRDSLRSEGYGSARPVEGLEPEDPANRRIEFSVISIMPQVPTPVDTPDAG
ncbi:OmpA family protein [Croceicoccus naphthovorans]|uniref:OmpA family protein n=1 Tax=Croceicoccus naphthovorans TaxID=1348774 RepID=UPI001FDFC2CA|nr:OmpA family protein [Croceicoccus naphthovorans]